jgi:GntR family transcriptional regulator
MTIGRAAARQSVSADARRLRDLLWSEILRDELSGVLPISETQLMAAHGASRTTVRQALALLQKDGILERRQRVGTRVVRKLPRTRLAELQGVMLPVPGDGSVLTLPDGEPEVLESVVVPMPYVVAKRLDATAGVPCLRIDYVQWFAGEPGAVTTNYVAFPEAAALQSVRFRSHWYAYFEDASVEIGSSEFVFGCRLADDAIAPLLRIDVGAAVMWMEEIYFALDGRPFNFATSYMRSDSSILVSRVNRD